MTIARTLAGEIVGQVCDLRRFTDSPRYALTQDDVDNGPFLYLLGRDGRYVTVRRSSVRLEEV